MLQICGEFEKAANTVAGIKCFIALKVPAACLNIPAYLA